MKDSGHRNQFPSGAVRDIEEGKSRPDLISPYAADRLARWLAIGAAKYSPRNWERGIPFNRCLASLERHLIAYKQGLDDEDHLAAIMCNAMFLAHYESMIALGVLPANLDDMPHYAQKGKKCSHTTERRKL